MASDNPGFIHTEDTIKSRSIGDTQDTVRPIEQQIDSDKNERNSQTTESTLEHLPVKSSQIARDFTESPKSHEFPKTERDGTESGAELGTTTTTTEENQLRKRRSIDNGTAIENGSITQNGSIGMHENETTRNESKENGKFSNGKISVLNGSSLYDSFHKKGTVSAGSDGGDACERGAAGGDPASPKAPSWPPGEAGRVLRNAGGDPASPKAPSWPPGEAGRVLRNGGGDPASPKAPSWPPGEAGRVLRNAIGVGAVFMVHFTATLGVTHLQSSVNKEQGLGTSALAAQYAGLVISSLVLSVFLISKLGCKWTIVVAIVCNVPYMLAQMWPRTWTLVPTAFLMGLALAPLWSAKCTYLCALAEARAALTGRALAAVRDRIIGVFFMVFLLSMVWGNLVSSLVLSNGATGASGGNVTEALCGVAFCPNSAAASANPNLERPPQSKITLIIGIYVAFMLLGALVAATYLDSLTRYSSRGLGSPATAISTRALLTATLALHRRKEMLLLLPLSIWLGVDYAFIEAEYTASFVACAWGIERIGYVIVVYGLANSGLALATGWIVSRWGRRRVLCAGAVLHAALMGGVLAWRPSPDHAVLFFVVAALWGAADGHWCVQLNSLYAILFPNMEEAAYSNFRLWQSIGFVIAFSYSHYLCTAYKLYVVMALLAAGVAGYLGIEYSRPEKERLAAVG